MQTTLVNINDHTSKKIWIHINNNKSYTIEKTHQYISFFTFKHRLFNIFYTFVVIFPNIPPIIINLINFFFSFFSFRSKSEF